MILDVLQKIVLFSEEHSNLGSAIFNTLSLDKDVWSQTRNYLIGKKKKKLLIYSNTTLFLDRLITANDDKTRQRFASCIVQYMPSNMDSIVKELEEKDRKFGPSDGLLFFYKEFAPFKTEEWLASNNHSYMVRYLLQRPNHPIAQHLIRSLVDDEVISSCLLEITLQSNVMRDEYRKMRSEIQELKQTVAALTSLHLTQQPQSQSQSQPQLLQLQHQHHQTQIQSQSTIIPQTFQQQQQPFSHPSPIHQLQRQQQQQKQQKQEQQQLFQPQQLPPPPPPKES